MSLWVFPGPEKTARDASLAGLKEREEDDEGKKSTNEMMHRLPPPPLRKHPNRPRGLRARRARPFREGEGARHAALCRHRLTCRAKEKASESCAARSKKEELRLFESSLCVCGSSGGALEKEEEEEEEGGGGPLPCFGPPQRQPSLAGLLKDRALHCRDLERTVACTRLLLRRSAKRRPLPPPPLLLFLRRRRPGQVPPPPPPPTSFDRLIYNPLRPSATFRFLSTPLHQVHAWLSSLRC